jgi:hypothetical protein
MIHPTRTGCLTCHHQILQLKYEAPDGNAGRQDAGLLHEGGLTMAGLFRDAAKTVQVADFSYYPNDSLAQMIVDAWVDADFKNLLLTPGNAKTLFATRGFYWNGTMKTPVVISEDQYNAGHALNDPDHEIVFVLPNHNGTCPPGQSLLDTARLLMAATPNGI